MNLIDWEDVTISNETPNIDLIKDISAYTNYFSSYGTQFYRFVLTLIKTGIIYCNGNKYEFKPDNYIDTTFFNRAVYNDLGVLLAGDVITFQSDNIDFSIFITRVKSINTSAVLSLIKSSIYCTPGTEIVLSKDNMFSTVKDNQGNCYSIKVDDLSDMKMTQMIMTFLNDTTQPFVPSNSSEYFTSNNKFTFIQKDSMDNLFSNNLLKYYPDGLKSEPVEPKVIIPTELYSESDTDTVKPFKCIINGIFSVHRTRKVNGDLNLQCLNFEIYFDKEISTTFNSDGKLEKIDIGFFEYYLENGDYYVKFKKDYTHTSCFFSSNDFYETNIYDESKCNKFKVNVMKIHSFKY